ncbi:LysR family transcriptional regulator [Aestuariispira insulae]|uniref:LysR family transcriptional regulator n=1 Tax=Aestuariispira insulae TaxID=1461337 RepID=A0A3D9HY11_9PROT|nr:LysR family transcriptional regulator [Aestuariispira insulae]RED54383.1 LysR family transcriptional regulator [Aestuariispira insulae]
MFQSKDLHLVRTLAESGRMADAAEKLGLHHSTIFRQLRDLEESLGYPLFTKADQRYHPTPAAEQIASLADDIDRQLAGLERKLAGAELAPEGRVRLTTTDSLFYDRLMPLLADFHQVYPRIQLEILVDCRAMMLNRREADIALRPTNSPPETLVGRRLGLIQTAIYAAEQRLKRNDWINLEDLPWIGFEDSLGHLRSARWLSQTCPNIEPVIRVNSLHAAFHLARSGLGLALLPTFLGDPCKELARLEKPNADWNTDLWLLTHPDLRHSPRIRAVLDFLADHLTVG